MFTNVVAVSTVAASLGITALPNTVCLVMLLVYCVLLVNSRR